MERKCFKKNYDYSIVKNANETVGNIAFSLASFQRVITVGLGAMKIVNGLPVLEID